MHDLEIEFKDILDEFFEEALKRLRVAKRTKDSAEEFIIRGNAAKEIVGRTKLSLIGVLVAVLGLNKFVGVLNWLQSNSSLKPEDEVVFP